MALTWADVESGAFADKYWEDGYAIIHDVFTPAEVAEMKARFDFWYEENMKHPQTFVQGNTRTWIEHYGDKGRVVRGMQWPSYKDPALDKFRTDARMLAILEPLIGPNVKQIINQMHWKKPGFPITWRMHQDVRSRKPDDCYRDLFKSYVQIGIAVDAHTADTGAMGVIPKSQKRGDLKTEEIADRLEIGGYDLKGGDRLLAELGYSEKDIKVLEMPAGAVALWTPHTIHGGGVNTAGTGSREFYINGYVKAENCDRGHLVFSEGKAQPLGDPVHIQIDDFADHADKGIYTSEEKLCKVRD